jgi:hypothetical protein
MHYEWIDPATKFAIALLALLTAALPLLKKSESRRQLLKKI